MVVVMPIATPVATIPMAAVPISAIPITAIPITAVPRATSAANETASTRPEISVV